MHQPTVTVTNTMTDINLNMIQNRAYIVINVRDTYFANNLYLRMSTDGRWMASTTLKVDGGWHSPVKYRLKCVILNTKGKHKGKHKKYFND